MKRLILSILIGFLLSTAQTYAKSNDLISDLQNEAEELNAPSEAEMQSVEMLNLGCGPCQEWISDRGWDEGKNIKGNGNYFFVQSDSAVISAPPGSPNYINSRQNAYVKALINAKKNILKFIESEITREVTFDEKEGDFTWEKEAALDNSKPQEESALQAIKRKTLRLINATLDEKLQEKGVDPKSDDPADRRMAEEVAREVVNTEKFRDIVRSSSQQQLKGIRRIFVSESIKKGEQGEICVVALYSPKTMAMADAIFTDPSLAPKGTPNKPIREQIPNWKTPKGVSELLSTFGTEMLRDQNGQFHVITYAQSAPKSNTKKSQNIAVQKARLRAEAELRTFAQEYAALNETAENTEVSRELADAFADYDGGDAFEKTIKSVSGPSKISGIRQLGVWGAKHPLTGQTIIGSIVGWSPDDATIAKQMKSELNAKPKPKRMSSANKSSRFKNDDLKAKSDYQGSASGGSSEDDF
jgi:hypothetical protein